MRFRRCLFLALAATTTGAVPASLLPTAATFDWDSITPSHDIEYHDCYKGFKCARLYVPLDWKNESDPRQISLAMIKLPAVVPDDDPTFRGSIFTNPGGPGGSGVSLVVSQGRSLQGELVDVPGRQHYEIISFDPRGIGQSRPLSDCFRSSHFARTAWNLEVRGIGDLDTGKRAIGYSLAVSESFSRKCQETEESWGEEVMRYVNTPSVARDMVEMVDKVEELRKRELLKKHGDESRLELRKRDGQAVKDEKPRLQYFGYSYGTVLGNYFASLFPERVGRLVLDGVANSVDYATGPGWLTNLVDTDEIFKQFWDGCFKAGADLCPFVKTDESAAAAQKRFWDWLEALDETPLPIASPAGGILVLTSGDVRDVVGTDLYRPLVKFKPLAILLHEAMAGNTTGIAQRIARTLPNIEDTCPSNNQTGHVVVNPEAESAVLCSDGDDLSHYNASWWQEYVSKEKGLSKLFGARWTQIRFSCSRWPFRPNWSFKGPFTTPEPNPDVPGSPAAPILFLSNRLDPVTPLSAARAMSKQHPGSAVVVQDAMGHCTGNGPQSKCLSRIVQDYFYNGTVPTEETLCKPDCGPWDENCREMTTSRTNGLHAQSVNSLYGPNEDVRRFPLGLHYM